MRLCLHICMTVWVGTDVMCLETGNFKHHVFSYQNTKAVVCLSAIRSISVGHQL